ncbi:hypothetical protein ZYGR_0AL01140 [Zygosaccharomyces rouxii]|uniref:Uncharacterized protein n=1 Tax=Zygosaccharomyces rouxii TaxID=4956 RepID=A0A1Q3AFC8_ZYGRO|nr:hypothetical protein ZYGR_0AL01140 [Zygosaccharomyces rouxii]
MRILQILTLANLSTCMAGASKLSNFVSDFLDRAEYNENWDEDTARDYVNQLVEKHGAKVQEQINQITEDERVAYASSLQEEEAKSCGKKWHVGDATLTKLDKSVIGSAINKLRDSLPSWVSWDKTNLQDYGVYFFSVSDTDIFEGLDEG